MPTERAHEKVCAECHLSIGGALQDHSRSFARESEVDKLVAQGHLHPIVQSYKGSNSSVLHLKKELL